MGDAPDLQHATDAETPLIGSWAAIPHPTTAELVADLGYDFVAVEGEHSPVSYETMADVLRGIDAADGDAETLVRVADHDPTTLKRTLDLGPDAVLVPMVDTAEQAERVVRATRHPPAGERGIGAARSADYGRSLAEQIAAGDDAFATHVQLESERAVDNAADIAAVDGVDGVFVGPMDLSLSMGSFGEWADRAFRDAVDRAVAAARDADVAVGTIATDEASRERRLDWDVDYVVAGVDLLHLAEGATEALEHGRAVAEDR